MTQDYRQTGFAYQGPPLFIRSPYVPGPTPDQSAQIELPVVGFWDREVVGLWTGDYIPSTDEDGNEDEFVPDLRLGLTYSISQLQLKFPQAHFLITSTSVMR